MRMEEAFCNVFMYLYNKNILEYAQIARSGPKSMIRDIEGPSSIYEYTSSNVDKIHSYNSNFNPAHI